MNASRAKTAGAAVILEHFTSDDPIHERNAPKRALADVTRAWPGDAHRLWWKWYSEAAINLGLRTKTLDCTIDEACALAHNRAQLICYREESPNATGEWMSVMAKSKRGFNVLFAGDHDETKSVSPRGLRKAFSRFATEDRVRCVVMQSNGASFSADLKGEGKSLSPVSRLWRLLRPEAPDIWIVVVFAFTVALLMLATPIAVEALVNTVAFGRFLQPIIVLALILLTFLGFQGAIRGLQTYVVEIVQRRLFARVAGDLAYRLPRTESAQTAAATERPRRS